MAWILVERQRWHSKLNTGLHLVIKIHILVFTNYSADCHLWYLPRWFGEGSSLVTNPEEAKRFANPFSLSFS